MNAISSSVAATYSTYNTNNNRGNTKGISTQRAEAKINNAESAVSVVISAEGRAVNAAGADTLFANWGESKSMEAVLMDMQEYVIARQRGRVFRCDFDTCEEFEFASRWHDRYIHSWYLNNGLIYEDGTRTELGWLRAYGLWCPHNQPGGSASADAGIRPNLSAGEINASPFMQRMIELLGMTADQSLRMTSLIMGQFTGAIDSAVAAGAFKITGEQMEEIINNIFASAQELLAQFHEANRAVA